MTANVSLGEQHPKLIFLRCSNLLCVVAVHCALMFRLFRLSFGQQLCWSPGLTTSPQTVNTSTPPARTVPSVTRNFQILITGTAPTTCHNMSQRLSFDASAGAEWTKDCHCHPQSALHSQASPSAWKVCNKTSKLRKLTCPAVLDRVALYGVLFDHLVAIPEKLVDKWVDKNCVGSKSQVLWSLHRHQLGHGDQRFLQPSFFNDGRVIGKAGTKAPEAHAMHMAEQPMWKDVKSNAINCSKFAGPMQHTGARAAKHAKPALAVATAYKTKITETSCMVELGVAIPNSEVLVTLDWLLGRSAGHDLRWYETDAWAIDCLYQEPVNTT